MWISELFPEADILWGFNQMADISRLHLVLIINLHE